MRGIKQLAIILAASTALSLPSAALAQGASSDDGKEILVTGSRIKRDPANSALPLTIISPADLSREGISSAEQLISYLSTNGNGADNLASNSDVVGGAQRGTNEIGRASCRERV